MSADWRRRGRVKGGDDANVRREPGLVPGTNPRQIGIPWDEPGGVGAIADIAGIAVIARDRRTKSFSSQRTQRTQRRKNRKKDLAPCLGQNHAKLGYLGMNREGQGRGDQYRKLRTQARAPALHKFFGVHRQECLCHKTIIAIIAGIARDREPKAFHRKAQRRIGKSGS